MTPYMGQQRASATQHDSLIDSGTESPAIKPQPLAPRSRASSNLMISIPQKSTAGSPNLLSGANETSPAKLPLSFDGDTVGSRHASQAARGRSLAQRQQALSKLSGFLNMAQHKGVC